MLSAIKSKIIQI